MGTARHFRAVAPLCARGSASQGRCSWSGGPRRDNNTKPKPSPTPVRYSGPHASAVILYRSPILEERLHYSEDDMTRTSILILFLCLLSACGPAPAANPIASPAPTVAFGTGLSNQV